MAPIKFENNIKEKLEQRRLQPSTDAWKTLQSKLESNASNKNNRTFWWLGIAASFVGVLIMVSLFFNNDVKSDIDPIIVDVDSVDQIEESQIVDQSNINSINDKTDNLIDETQKQETNEKNTSLPILKKQLQKKQNQLTVKDSKEVLAQADIKGQTERKEDAVLTKTITFEDLKVQEVLAQINALKEANNQVTDAEIDALLDRAENEIKLQKLYDESTNTVNADALLQGVEADLDQSFRDRIFEAIKSGYKEVKTAVVERNN